MENQTRFNLNEALTKWRTEELESHAGVSADTARELESHLRDSVTDLQSKGLSDEEAFWLAQRRLGSPEKLAAEITKADPAGVWTERVFWMLGGVLAMHILTTAIFTPLSIAAYRWNGSMPVGIFHAFQAAIYVLIAAFALLVAHGKFPKILMALSRCFGSSRRLFGVAALVAILPAFQIVWILLQVFGQQGHPNTIVKQQTISMFITYLWPVVVCYLLVHLRRRLPNRMTGTAATTS